MKTLYIYIYPLREYAGPSFPHSLLRTRDPYKAKEAASGLGDGEPRGRPRTHNPEP